MKRFPSEFDALLDRNSSNDLLGLKRSRPSLRREKLAWYPNLVSEHRAKAVCRFLQSSFSDVLKPYRCPIPKSAIERMEVTASEELPKTMSCRSAMLNSPRSRASKTAKATGLSALLRSDSLRQVAEAVSGKKLEDDPGCQVICYEPGDYVGPHNDHHPEYAHLRAGYVDVHLMFSTPSVQQQFLIYEKGGYLNNVVDVSIRSAMSISLLPFWHCVTPLVSKPGSDRFARRWLLLASYCISSKR